MCLPQVAVVGLASGVTYARDDSCLQNSLVPMTLEAKFFFNRFIENLKKEEGTIPVSLMLSFQHDMCIKSVLICRSFCTYKQIFS